MALRFHVFRKVLCVILVLIAAVSISLGAILSQHFLRPGVAWLLVSVEIFSLVRAIWSAIRKPVFSSPQPVASETIGLFVLFPFQLIIALLGSAISEKDNTHAVEFTVLRAFVMGNALIHLAYTVVLVVIAALTVPAFDGDVWMRDIDSSPSPFPLAVIFAFVCPCIARRFSATRSFVHQSVPPDPPLTVCLPSCDPNCRFHGNVLFENSKPNGLVTDTENGSPVVNSHTQHKEHMKRTPPILPHNLVRIPTAAEQSAYIYLDLPIGES